MLVDVALKSVLEELGTLLHRSLDEVIPNLQPALPTNCYRQEYAWQHSYERALMRRAQTFIGEQRNELIGATGLLSELLSNAYVHGNQRDPDRPIFVELFVGTNGYVLRVAQSGGGFDYRDVVAKFRRSQQYYSIGGNGLRRLDRSETFRAFFDDDGCAVHIWYPNSTPTHRERRAND